MQTANDGKSGMVFVVEILHGEIWVPRRLAYPGPTGVREVLEKLDVLIDKYFIDTGRFRIKRVWPWEVEAMRERIASVWE